jgi:streptomycin 6-kinase
MEAAISCNFHCKRLSLLWKDYWPEADPAELAADVMDRARAASAAWGLSPLEPLDGGMVALTCATTRAGRPVVLKVNPRGHREERQLAGEGEALAFWRPTGAAAELLGSRDDGFTLLLERLEPGHTLDDAGLGPEERLTELGRLAARLHEAGPPPDSFMGLSDFVPGWPVPPGEAAEDERLVHLDLHGGNALRTDRGWKVIDPKGIRADRHTDVWALIDPVGLEALPEEAKAARATARRWVDVYAEAAELDPARAREWTRIRARAEVAESGGWPGLERIAEALG